MKLILLCALISFVHAQTCTDSCMVTTVVGGRTTTRSVTNDNICDETNGICVSGTDCSDCSGQLPVWEVAVSSLTGVFALITTVSALFGVTRRNKEPAKTKPIINKIPQAPVATVKPRSSSVPIQRPQVVQPPRQPPPPPVQRQPPPPMQRQPQQPVQRQPPPMQRQPQQPVQRQPQQPMQRQPPPVQQQYPQQVVSRPTPVNQKIVLSRPAPAPVVQKPPPPRLVTRN